MTIINCFYVFGVLDLFTSNYFANTEKRPYSCLECMLLYRINEEHSTIDNNLLPCNISFIISGITLFNIYFFTCSFILFVRFFRAAPEAYGGSQARVFNWSCSHQPAPQTQKYRILALSVTYTTAHGNDGSLTH